jgi:hypothetical protein
MAYKLDNPIFFAPDKAHPDRHIQIGGWRGPIALDGDIDAQVDALPDLTDDEKVTVKVEVREGWTMLQARVDDTLPPPSAAQAWEAEMLRLNKIIRDDFRYWEESAAGAISQAAATRMAAQVAAAKAHRASRPK